jgi:centrosomal protein CEP104
LFYFCCRDDDDDDGNGNHFAQGEHPLDGVPNLSELAAPEALKGKSRELSEQTGITNLIGEYRARCLFSKVWTLRDAAITKVQMMLQDEFESEPGIFACLAVLSAIVRVGVEDKIQQVLFSAISFMDAILAATRRAKLPRSVVAPLMDPVVAILIEKLSDGNARIREGARKGLEVLAASTNIGSTVVASHGIKPLPSKQASAWRPISTRLQLLTDLVTTYGIGGGTGLATEGVMNFAKAAGAFAHSNAEVRDSAKELTVAVHAVVGTGAIDGYLRALRPKQLEEYHAAFEGNPTAQKKESNNNGEHKSPDAKQHHSAAHSPAGKVNTSAVKGSADNGDHD